MCEIYIYIIRCGNPDMFNIYIYIIRSGNPDMCEIYIYMETLICLIYISLDVETLTCLIIYYKMWKP